MKFSARQIADVIDGKIEGDADRIVSGLSKIEQGEAGTLSFLAHPKYEEFIYSTRASIVIVNASFAPRQVLPEQCTLIRVPDAYAAFSALLELYDKAVAPSPRIDPLSFVDSSASIGEEVYIGAFTSIGKNVVIHDGVHVYPNCSIGDNVTVDKNTVIYSGVHIYRDCRIGKSCTIHSGAVIGADGFGFAPDAANQYQRVPQIGHVVLEDNVSVGANTTIDRATLGTTTVERGVKLDNLVQIGHNVVVGKNTVIAAQTGVAGSTRLGENMMIGGQVGIVGHIEIAEGVKIGAQSGVGKTIRKAGETVLGSPAYAIEDYKKSYLGFRKLPSILERLNALETTIAALEKKQPSNG